MACIAIPRGIVLQEDTRGKLELVLDVNLARSEKEKERKSD